MKIFTRFKKLTFTALPIFCFWVGVNWAVPAGISYPLPLDRKRPKQHPVMVAQSESRPITNEKTAPLSESSASESKPQEKEKSDEAREKPLKEFRPSERIEAEQAVDFPYDI